MYFWSISVVINIKDVPKLHHKYDVSSACILASLSVSSFPALESIELTDPIKTIIKWKSPGRRIFYTVNFLSWNNDLRLNTKEEKKINLSVNFPPKFIRLISKIYIAQTNLFIELLRDKVSVKFTTKDSPKSYF